MSYINSALSLGQVNGVCRVTERWKTDLQASTFYINIYMYIFFATVVTLLEIV